jgi:hypothetical protein
MAVMLVHQGQSLTRERYEQVVARLTGGKPRLESLSDWPVEGILSHSAAEGPDGFMVVDIWENEEAVGRFGETLGPLLQEAGVHEQPQVFPAHTFVKS